MGEWHEHLTRPKPLLTNVVLHDGVAARETVLVPEAVEDALRSVPLLAVAGPIVFQDPIDDSRERTQLWPPRRRASAIPWRHRERQHLTDRLAVYTKHPRGLAGAHPLDMTRPPNPCVQLHPIHPPRLPVRATLTEGYTRSHFGPPQPDRPAASVGDYCSAVLMCRPSQPGGDRGHVFVSPESPPCDVSQNGRPTIYLLNHMVPIDAYRTLRRLASVSCICKIARCETAVR